MVFRRLVHTAAHSSSIVSWSARDESRDLSGFRMARSVGRIRPGIDRLLCCLSCHADRPSYAHRIFAPSALSTALADVFAGLRASGTTGKNPLDSKFIAGIAWATIAREWRVKERRPATTGKPWLLKVSI